MAGTKKNMAYLLHGQGELARAGGLLRESAAIYSKVLGAEHAQTLNTHNSARLCEQSAA